MNKNEMKWRMRKMKIVAMDKNEYYIYPFGSFIPHKLNNSNSIEKFCKWDIIVSHCQPFIYYWLNF